MSNDHEQLELSIPPDSAWKRGPRQVGHRRRV